MITRNSLKSATKRFPQGTRVRWGREFLRSICDHSAESADRTGTVLSDKPTSYSPTHHIVSVKWDDAEEPRGAATSNLVPEDRLPYEH